VIASQAVVCLEGRREYLTRVLAIELELARRETVPSRRDAKLKALRAAVRRAGRAPVRTGRAAEDGKAPGRWTVSTTSRSMHAICADCWDARNPEHPVVRQLTKDNPDVPCCFCGKPPTQGIYIRANPDTIAPGMPRCGGSH
jgi:hypothetical protein